MNANSSYTVPDYPQIKPQSRNLNKENSAKHVLYFSNYCNNSKKLLGYMQKEGLVDKVDYICIDNRFIKDNVTYIRMPNNASFPLPPMINCVPTLCLMPNHEILSGGKILNYFKPMCKSLDDERVKLNMEPNPYCLDNETSGSFGVSSDNFSFWDTNPDDLSASGNGGMRQTYSYATLNEGDSSTTIHTPQDEGKEQKMSMSLEQLQQMRKNEL